MPHGKELVVIQFCFKNGRSASEIKGHCSPLVHPSTLLLWTYTEVDRQLHEEQKMWLT